MSCALVCFFGLYSNSPVFFRVFRGCLTLALPLCCDYPCVVTISHVQIQFNLFPTATQTFRVGLTGRGRISTCVGEEKPLVGCLLEIINCAGVTFGAGQSLTRCERLTGVSSLNYRFGI